jgi:glyoxylate/hydroxypyruvate reductase
MIIKRFLRDHYKNFIYYQMSNTNDYSTKKFNVFVTQPIPQQAIDILNKDEKINLNINTQTPLTRKKLLESVQNCDAIFCTLNEKIDKELLDTVGRDKLKIVATCSVGYDHIDIAECNRRNIKVGYTPGVLTNATAELTIGILLNTTRRISESIQAAKDGQWQDWKIMWMCGQGLHGSNIGIFGCGRIGESDV